MKINFKTLFLVITSSLIVYSGNAQGLSTKEADSIHFRIYDFWQRNAPDVDSASSELFFIVLQTNAESKIVSIHLLADQENNGIAYRTLRKINTSVFSNLSLDGVQNSSILIPVYCNGTTGKAHYADIAQCEPTFAGLNSRILSTCKSSIMTSGILLFQPYKEKH